MQVNFSFNFQTEHFKRKKGCIGRNEWKKTVLGSLSKVKKNVFISPLVLYKFGRLDKSNSDVEFLKFESMRSMDCNE